MSLEKDIQELTQAVKALTEALEKANTVRVSAPKPEPETGVKQDTKPEVKTKPETKPETKTETKPGTGGEPSIAALYAQDPAKAFDVLKTYFLELCELDDQQAVDLLAQFKDKNGVPAKRLSAILPEDYELFLRNLRSLLKED